MSHEKRIRAILEQLDAESLSLGESMHTYAHFLEELEYEIRDYKESAIWEAERLRSPT